jgi:MFS family permease
LALYGATIGATNGALTTYVPSYSQETFGFDTTTGGLLFAVCGIVAFVTRLSAGHLSERFFGHHRTLMGMAMLTALAGVLLASAPSGAWLWPAAVCVGLGPMAWNVVGNLAVMELSPKGGAGRGSGVMMAGFLGGTALGAPLLGGSADLLGTYRPGWLGVAALGLIAIWIAKGVVGPSASGDQGGPHGQPDHLP